MPGERSTRSSSQEYSYGAANGNRRIKIYNAISQFLSDNGIKVNFDYSPGENAISIGSFFKFIILEPDYVVMMNTSIKVDENGTSYNTIQTIQYENPKLLDEILKFARQPE